MTDVPELKLAVLRHALLLAHSSRTRQQGPQRACCPTSLALQALCAAGKQCLPSCVCPSGTHECNLGKCKPYCGTGNSCTADCVCPASTSTCSGGVCKVGLLLMDENRGGGQRVVW